jgi:hypothetical protein
VTAAILVPVLVGLLIWGIEQLMGTALQTHNVGSAREPLVDLKPVNDICSKLNIGLQCTLTELSPSDYVTRRIYDSLKGVPVCDSPSLAEEAQFSKWAKTNTIPGGNLFLLDITSHTDSIVNLGTTQISVANRYPTLATDDIGCAGGAEFPLGESINLDNNPPTVTYFCGTNQQKCSRPLITLRPGDNAEIMIRAYNMRNVVEWTGRLEIIVNGHILMLNLGTHTSASLPQPISCSPDGGTWQPCARYST